MLLLRRLVERYRMARMDNEPFKLPSYQSNMQTECDRILMMVGGRGAGKSVVTKSILDNIKGGMITVDTNNCYWKDKNII